MAIAAPALTDEDTSAAAHAQSWVERPEAEQVAWSAWNARRPSKSPGRPRA
jgi:hypothetical protein